MQVGQLAKQLVEQSTGNFVTNTKKNPKKEHKVVLTRSKRKESLEKEEGVKGVVENVSAEEVEDERKKKMAENKKERTERRKH